MKIEKIEFESFLDFFHSIMPTGKLNKTLNLGYIFRGEATNKYDLLPTALRKNNKNKLWGLTKIEENMSELEYWQVYAEYVKIREFYKTANYNGLKVPHIKGIQEYYTQNVPWELIIQWESTKWITNEIAELAALAQHYGIPTRLLDWSFDPFVALYFASIGAITLALQNNKLQDNDKMVIWALNSEKIQSRKPTVAKIPLNFVVPSYYNNPNLNAQKGVLTYWEIDVDCAFTEIKKFQNNTPSKPIDRTPLNDLLNLFCKEGDDDHVILLYKFEFPVTDCRFVYDIIQQFGYSAASIFPGYSGVTKKIEDDLKAHELIEKFK